jgi:hypothetical protein
LLLSSDRVNYFTFDPNFPNRLIHSDPALVMVFVHRFYEDYSRRGLTEKTDRSVAISGLVTRMAGALKCQSRYGIFDIYLHETLLWQACDNKMARIKYPGRDVPSWSWMAYTGGIQFMAIAWDVVEWAENLRFDDERKLALCGDVGKFQRCTTKPDKRRHAILGFGGVERGWIQYDVEEESEDISKVRCVVIGSHEEAGHASKVWMYYILVVRLTSVDGEYERVGSGTIHKDYVVRERPNMRIV